MWKTSQCPIVELNIFHILVIPSPALVINQAFHKWHWGNKQLKVPTSHTNVNATVTEQSHKVHYPGIHLEGLRNTTKTSTRVASISLLRFVLSTSQIQVYRVLPQDHLSSEYRTKSQHKTANMRVTRCVIYLVQMLELYYNETCYNLFTHAFACCVCNSSSVHLKLGHRIN